MTPGVKTAPAPRCSCGGLLERDRSVKRPYWTCTNLYCPKKARKPTYIGSVQVSGQIMY